MVSSSPVSALTSTTAAALAAQSASAQGALKSAGAGITGGMLCFLFVFFLSYLRISGNKDDALTPKQRICVPLYIVNELYTL
jgi:hypothetical protein